MALSKGAREMLWLQQLFSDLRCQQSVYVLFCDSHNTIFMAHNHSSQRRSKHIDIHAHFIHHVVEEGKLQVTKIDTKVNPTDILTKVFGKEKFECAKTSLGLVKK